MTRQQIAGFPSRYDSLTFARSPVVRTLAPCTTQVLKNPLPEKKTDYLGEMDLPSSGSEDEMETEIREVSVDLTKMVCHFGPTT